MLEAQKDLNHDRQPRAFSERTSDIHAHTWQFEIGLGSGRVWGQPEKDI